MRPVVGIIRMDPEGASIPISIIPVNPPTIRAEGGITYTEVPIINYRDVGRRGNTKLAGLSWESFFPAHLSESWVNPSLPFVPAGGRPTGWVNLYRDIMETKTPCWVTVSGLAFARWMVLVDFKWDLDSEGEATDITYSMAWKEYVRTTSRVVQTYRPSSPTSPTSGTRYTIVWGDSLWSIAKRFYGSGSLWTVIWDANKPMTSGNPNLIYPGEVITIPSR